MTHVLDPFRKACERFPDRAAIIDRDGSRVTYAGLEAEAAALAGHWCEKGLKAGQRVLIAHPVSIALYRALIALWMAGCEAVFPEPFAGIRGLRHAKGLLAPSAAVSNGLGRLLLPLVAGSGMRMLSPRGAGARPADAPEPSEVALYSFTSGSTGTPKCIPRSHPFLLAQSAAVSTALASDRHEVDLVWFPVFVLACLANGGTAVLPDSALKRPDRPDTRALARQAAAHRVTRLLAPPAVGLALAAEPEMPRLAKVFTGGGPVMPHHFRAIARIAEEVVAIYGSTEAEPIAVLSSHDIAASDLQAMAGGAGLLAGAIAPDLRIRIVDDEIQVAGDHVVQRYLDPRHDAENKVLDNGTVWHRTGDGGRIDDRGRLWLRGRIRGRIGDVWPLEIETMACCHDGVAAAALAHHDGRPVLAVVRDHAHRGSLPKALAGAVTIVEVESLPMDKRHASKLDYGRLQAEIARVAPSGDLG